MTTDRRIWFPPLMGVVMLIVAAVTGGWRDLWWLWMTFWITDAVGLFVSQRLVYWQRRHIEALKEGQVLDLILGTKETP